MIIAVASGKGGTGKTTVSASLSQVWEAPVVSVDLDVEEPNLGLFLHPDGLQTEQVAAEIPVLDMGKCTLCRICADFCQFKAITILGKTPAVFPEMCHSCGGCLALCPEGALIAGERELGCILQGDLSQGPFLMGRLRIGEAMSPPLIQMVKKRLRTLLEDNAYDAVIDAPPGVSCPAVNAVSDSDVIVLVTEPTPFGLHDLALAVEAFRPLGKPMGVVINRDGIGDAGVRNFCTVQKLPILAGIPFQREIAAAYSQGQCISRVSRELELLFSGLRDAIRALAHEKGYPMREVVIISGKGGAGKTSLAGAFAKLVPGAVLCDYDVDTPDLHILLEPETKESHEFWSGHEAIIQAEKCTDCGRCFDMCRFEAVEKQNGKQRVNSLKCEGCKVCVAFCPEGAISFEPKRCGDWYVSETRFGIFVHARLYPGEENSGLLVNVLKKQAQALAKKSGADFILSDGTPGLGCSVISSLRGAHLAVTVTEPTPSGRHDFERVAELCDSLKVPVAVLINKCDLNTDEAARIKEVCRTKGYACIAELPFEPLVTQAMMQKKVVTELPETIFSGKIAAAWDQIAHLAYASR